MRARLGIVGLGRMGANLASGTLYSADRQPAGPYRLRAPARRTRHLRFNDLTEPEAIPRGTDFASVFRADVPVVVQHTRLDSRQPALALMSTMAFPGGA